MPRRRELTWQAGSDGRSGRWKKKYKGRTLYLGSARAKSDLEAYQQALDRWRERKAEIGAEEAARPKPHQQEYDEAIGEWEGVLAWSVDHGQDRQATFARVKLAELRRRLDRKHPSPVAAEDRLWSAFEWPQEALEAVAALGEGGAPPLTDEDLLELDSETVVCPSEKATDWLDGSPARLQREAWRDRLGRQPQSERTSDETIEVHLARYLSEEQTRFEAGELSAARFSAKKAGIEHFRDWAGGGASVTAIDGKMLLGFRGHLLKKIKMGELARCSAHDYLAATKTFVGWLWETDVLVELPRLLKGRSKKLTIKKKQTQPRTYTANEIQTVLSQANERTKLYLLLMLNTGAYQKDISDLRQSEVDWASGRVERKRSKTADHEEVPVVCYKLWPATLRLLKKHRKKKGDRVLLNRNGDPLVVHTLTPDGKPRTTDAIKNAYFRLQKKTKIEKPLKLFRKTAASRLEGDKRYRGLVHLFLGLSPRTIPDKHYVTPPQELLDEGVEWLGKELGIT